MKQIRLALRSRDSSFELGAQELSDLYRDRAHALTAYFARRVYDADTAADLMAETFAAAFLARRACRATNVDEAAAWLFGIAQKQLAMYARRGRVERRALGRLGLQPPVLDEEDQRRVEALAELPAVRRQLAQGLGELSSGQRDALRLRVVDDLPYADVAARLEITEEAARTRVSRALRTLSNAIDRVAIEEGAGR